MVSSPSDGGFVRAALHGYKRYAVGFMRFCDPEPFPPKTEFLSTTDGREDGEMIRSPIDHCWSWRGFLTQVKVHIPDIETD
jgi:hypothetical protein